MAIPQTSGPAWLYIARIGSVATPTTAQLYFLGSCEQPPTLQLNPQWEPVMNDQGGSLLPIDYSYQGEDGLFSGTLNKWNETVYKQLANHGIAQLAGAGARGSELWSDIGMLSQTEYWNGTNYVAGMSTFQLFVHFPYAVAKTVYGTTNNMPAGMRFLACRLAGHVLGPGTRANRRQIIAHADRARVESATAALNGFTLYDHAMTTTTTFPAVPPVGVTGQVSLG